MTFVSPVLPAIILDSNNLKFSRPGNSSGSSLAEVDRRSALGNETRARDGGAERGTSGEEGSEVKDEAADQIEDIVREEEIKISGDEEADVDAAEASADEKQVIAPPPPPPGNDDSVVDDDQGTAKITTI